jgi:hypothetical protein
MTLSLTYASSAEVRVKLRQESGIQQSVVRQFRHQYLPNFIGFKAHGNLNQISWRIHDMSRPAVIHVGHFTGEIPIPLWGI